MICSRKNILKLLELKDVKYSFCDSINYSHCWQHVGLAFIKRSKNKWVNYHNFLHEILHIFWCRNKAKEYRLKSDINSFENLGTRLIWKGYRRTQLKYNFHDEYLVESFVRGIAKANGWKGVLEESDKWIEHHCGKIKEYFKVSKKTRLICNDYIYWLPYFYAARKLKRNNY